MGEEFFRLKLGGFLFSLKVSFRYGNLRMRHLNNVADFIGNLSQAG